MSSEIKQIAERLKALREISGYSIEALAQEFGVSTEVYLAYEEGMTDIPISFLFKAAWKFGVQLTALLTGEDPKLRTYSLVRKGKGLVVNRRKEYKYQNLAYNFHNKKAEPFLVTVEPQDENSPIPLNSHPGQEFNYVVEGSVKIIIGKHTVILNEGDSLYFDSSQKHGMQALNGKTAKFLAIIL
jgi:quercetin dioxygenase-like cupin family protein/DNA-binding XRE family transcriptional regulator